MEKKRIFSGIQPSGKLHIGNYLGAVKNWVALQDQYDSIFCVVDLHAITVPQDPEELRRRTIEVARIYLAAGIDPEKSAIFVQSHVPEHAELAWILNTIAKMSELEKMTQFKDKANIDYEEAKIDKLNEMLGDVGDLAKKDIVEKISEMFYYYKSMSSIKKEKVGVGLFDYPVLMAADILLYGTDLVPVGKDQKQHIELARDLAERFNKKFGETFVIPKPYTTETSENIMGLDNPAKKMSKSAASEYNYISLGDDEELVRKKIKRSVTDSGSEIIYADDKPALKNLINIYSLLSGKSPEEIEKIYTGKGYADFKADLAEVIVNFLKPLQEKMAQLSDEKVLKILREGAEKVRPLARKKMEEVRGKVGFVR